MMMKKDERMNHGSHENQEKLKERKELTDLGPYQ
jgi:hypothetical protein